MKGGKEEGKRRDNGMKQHKREGLKKQKEEGKEEDWRGEGGKKEERKT